MFLLRLALLNISRNPRRSIITVTAVGVGVAAMIFLWAFQDGSVIQMYENVINLFTGHVQIHARGFEKKITPELVITDRDEILRKIGALKEVVGVSERVKCEALVGTTLNSRGVLLIGIDPERESRITLLNKHILQGVFLAQAGKREIVVGDRLAEKLGIQVGDKVVVMTQAADGTMAGFAYHLAGVFHTGSMQVDLLTAYITLDSSRELLGIDNQSHEIVIKLKNMDAIPGFMRNARPFLNAQKHEMLAWDEIVPEPKLWIQWYEAILKPVFLTIMIIIGVGIMNTMLMSVMERTKELGVMIAIGTSPARIVKLILLETLFLELLGMTLGIFVGCAASFYFGGVGISFAGIERALSQSFVSTVTYPRVHLSRVLVAVFRLTIITTLISLYPAWKAGKLEPVKAIYRS